MEENTYKKVFHYIQQQSQPVSPLELSRVTGKSRVSIHTALKKLLQAGDIEKHGSSPHVYYSRVSQNTAENNTFNIEDIKQKIEPILKKYPIIYAGIFGSVARGEAKEGSDIDIMIDYHHPFSLISMVGLERELTAVLGIPIDLVTEEGVSKYMRPAMLHDLRVIYGKR